MLETQVQSLGLENPLEKEMATHSVTLAWKIPWTDKPGRLQSRGPKRVGHAEWVTFSVFSLFFLIFIFTLFCFTVLYWFCHTLTWIHHRCTWVPNPEPPSQHPSHIISLGHPSAPAPSILYPVSCIETRLAICFLHDSIHVSMPFSQIIPPSPSPSESKSPFYTSVSLLLSRIQGYPYHLSKFHIYVLVYCIGVFLSGLLHSV